ncbi:hypothetical protein GALL_153520 [mine drainage metagenome]|uniref:Lipoprotein n=1 Tax=mine drainage metagenome TaxID=410659 RepID=A0A1J5SRD1_9ZZZZ
MKTVLAFTIAAILLSACGQKGPVSRPSDVVGRFKSRTFQISDHEHAVIFEVPAHGIPDRCVVYVDDSTRTSHMNCDMDTSSPIPDDAGELGR